MEKCVVVFKTAANAYGGLMSNFSFCHNVCKNRLLQRRQNASHVWENVKYFQLTKYIVTVVISEMFEEKSA